LTAIGGGVLCYYAGMSEQPKDLNQLDDDDRDETQAALDAVERAIGGHLSIVESLSDKKAQNQPKNKDKRRQNDGP
jgi:hypothetical protein